MSTSRRAVLEQPRRFVLDRRDVPEPGPGEVRVRVEACGVCGSDVKMWAGTHAFLRPPLVLGHEVVGHVDAVGHGVAGLASGTPVVVFPPVGCGACFHCGRGQPQLCEAMEFYGGQRAGGLSEHALVPAANVVALDPAVPPAHRVLIEPLAVAVHGVTRGGVAAGESVVVLGAGAIGLLAALAARAAGADPVLVVEIAPARRARAAALGFDVVDPDATSLTAAVAAAVRPEGADAVLECVGSAATIRAAQAVTRKGGRTVIVGNAPPEFRVDGLGLQRGDRSLIGVLMYERGDFDVAMRLLAGGLLDGLDADRLTTSYGLSAVAEAFEAAYGGDLAALRAVVEPSA